ncbi:MAG: flagellar M-ring protein FliF [Alphaproteobacteria bacterium]|nr:flagellar M-ring protein FliF [Alphaproteobacteria bacterium]
MNSFLETLKQLGPSRLGIMGAILVGLMMFFVFVSMRISTPDKKLLYADLSSSDAGAVAAKLEESNIPYEVSHDGSRIMVAESEVGRARLLLAESGLPNGGSMGYKIFDQQSGFGTTNFVQNINQVRALEGELARTISSMEGVKSARVHLVLPQRELFSRNSRPSSASVFLGVNGHNEIPNDKIVAIQSLVASAVPDLKSSNVSIIDSNGNLLVRGGDEETAQLSAKAEERRRNYETTLASKIEDQVSRIVGYGSVRATVTAEMNFDRISTNEELFDPNGQVLRSSQTTEENSTEREAAAQDVSVQNNLPGAGAGLLGGGEPSAEEKKTEEVTNYEISKTIRSTVREVGEIKHLSVAVLVDGSYTTDDKGTKEDTADDVKTYKPRTQEELDRITALVRSAVGFNEERGDKVDVVNMQFATVETSEPFQDDRLLFGFEKDKLLDMAEIITVSIMVILVVMLVLQPMVNRILTPSGPEIDDQMEANLLAAAPAAPQLTGPAQYAPAEAAEQESLIDIQGVEGKVKASAIKKVEEIVQNYPTETVSVIRSWMTQET